jgi:hypothetical protein
LGAVEVPDVLGEVGICDDLYGEYTAVAESIAVGADVRVSMSGRVLNVNGAAVPVTDEMFALYEQFVDSLDASGSGETVVNVDVAGEVAAVTLTYRDVAVDERGNIVGGEIRARGKVQGLRISAKAVFEGRAVSGTVAVDGLRVATFSGNL